MPVLAKTGITSALCKALPYRVGHSDELGPVFEEQLDDVTVVVLCRQVERRLHVL